MSNQQVGHGSSISFGTSNWQANIKWQTFKVGGVSVAVVPTSHLGLSAPASNNVEGNATSIAGKIHRLGPITAEVQYDPGAGKQPTIGGSPETITITFPNGETFSGSGYISEAGEIEIESDKLVTRPVTIERTAGWTHG